MAQLHCVLPVYSLLRAMSNGLMGEEWESGSEEVQAVQGEIDADRKYKKKTKQNKSIVG